MEGTEGVKENEQKKLRKTLKKRVIGIFLDNKISVL